MRYLVMKTSSLTVNDRIFELLKERGITQQELAERTGIATSTISDWKHKGSSPSADKISMICEALDIRTEELFGEVSDASLKGKQRVITENSELWELVTVYENMDEPMRRRMMEYAKRCQQTLLQDGKTGKANSNNKI